MRPGQVEPTNKQLRRGSHRTVRELERAIQEFLDAHNDQPRPFMWTKTAEEILASMRASRTGPCTLIASATSGESRAAGEDLRSGEGAAGGEAAFAEGRHDRGRHDHRRAEFNEEHLGTMAIRPFIRATRSICVHRGAGEPLPHLLLTAFSPPFHRACWPDSVSSPPWQGRATPPDRRSAPLRTRPRSSCDPTGRSYCTSTRARTHRDAWSAGSSTSLPGGSRTSPPSEGSWPS
jgi:hypothetical protein